MEKKLYLIKEEYDVPDCDYWTIAAVETHDIGLVYATEEEIKEYVKLHDKPVKYAGTNNGDAYEHHIIAQEIEAYNSISDPRLIPYWEKEDEAP